MKIIGVEFVDFCTIALSLNWVLVLSLAILTYIGIRVLKKFVVLPGKNLSMSMKWY